MALIFSNSFSQGFFETLILKIIQEHEKEIFVSRGSISTLLTKGKKDGQIFGN